MPINAREILDKYDLTDLSCDPERHKEVEEKWVSHVPEQWYGYALGGCPTTWANVIDEFLEGLKQIDTNFEIHQIKQKFGGLRLYVKYDSPKNTSHINKQILILEHALFHESMVP